MVDDTACGACRGADRLFAGSVAGLIGKGGCDAFEANKDATTVVAALPEALMQW